MSQDLPNYPFIIIGALIAVLCAFAVQRYKSKGDAARFFREGVIDELVGFYPPPGKWRKGFEGQLAIAMASIEVRVKKFRQYVPRRKLRGYDSTWKDLKIHCSDLTWEKCAAYTMYPSMRTDDDKDPKEMFYEKIEKLLTYAREA